MRKPRAIIYDDEVILLNLFKHWMVKRGYEVMAFSEPKVCPHYGEQSDRCTENHKCADIVITDFKMPNMTGLELLQSQHQRGCKMDIKQKAVISGDIERENKERIRQMGVSFFEKPLVIPEFSSWLAEREKHMDLSTPLSNI